MMHTFSRIIRRGRRPQASLTAGWVLYVLFGALSALLLSPRASRAQTPAGTPIVTITTLAFVGSNGLPYSVADTLTLFVGQAAGVTVIPPRSVITDPSTTVTFAHAVSNIGNAADGLVIAPTSRAGWTTRVYLDVDASGTLTVGDLLLTLPLALPMTTSAAILVQEDVPANAVRGTTDSIDVRVSSQFDASISDIVVDAASIRGAGIRVNLAKSVDRPTATVGDVVTYTITYTAIGAGTATALQIADVVPLGASYVPGTLRFRGAPVTDAADADAGAFDAANNAVVVRAGDVAAGQSGTVSFQTRVGNVAAGFVLTNIATSSFGTPVGPDSSMSLPVQTTALLPQISMQKQLLGPATARIGQLVQYRIHYENAAPNVSARSVVVVDTLAPGLDYVSAVPAATVNGSVLTWSMGDLAANTAADIALTVRVNNTVVDTVRVRNGAALGAVNVGTQTSMAAELEMIGTSMYALSLTKRADVVEAGIGETVPYTIVLQNTGTSPLSGVRIHDLLPAGGRYAANSATGADSVHIAGRDLTIFVSGALAPGASVTIRYAVAVVTASGRTFVNSAYASAENETVVSDAASAIVHVRSTMPMETRTGFGKVWADLDGDGRQSTGEPGIEGVDVWTDDGDVATTDADGRFSFRNLRPGRHTFRIDRATLPAGYRTAGADRAEDLAVRDASGWTTPRVDFRLVVSEGRVVGARVVKPGEIVTAYTCPRIDLRWTRADSLGVRQQGAPVDSAADPIPPAVAGRPECQVDSAIARAPLDTASARLVAKKICCTLTDELPRAATVPTGSEVDVAFQPPPTGWPGDATVVLPNGWQVVPNSSFFGDVRIADPSVGRDRTGKRLLEWERLPDAFALISVRLRSMTTGRAVDSARVALLRSAADRAAEKRRSLTQGQGVEIFSPRDGVVMASDRVYVGVRGEAGRPVSLFDGDTLVANATMRVDGVYDFIAVHLTRGPHRLRASIVNSLDQTRWDSMSVHVSGLAARFESERATVRMQADGNTVDSVRARVLDGWNVPVVGGVLVTVAAEGATPMNADADASSVGVQVRADEGGWFTVLLRPGHTVRRGKLILSAGNARGEVPLELLAAARPLMLSGIGRVGIGASPDAFAALTAKGRLDDKTSLTLSYDTRRLDAGRDAFARTADPLEAAQYPILGDAGTQRTETASRFALSAKVQRGFDWVALGDVTTTEFASGLELGAYRRSLAGAAARITTGALVVQGFGSSTAQAVRQLQLRGQGVSGPYTLALGIVAGTDRIAIETRAIENAQRVVSRQELVRFINYQIDYELGTLLLKQPLPAADVYGNPVYIVATFEANGSGVRSTVWGARASADAARLFSHSSLDTLRLGAMFVEDAQTGGAQHLSGIDLRISRRGWLDLGGELTRSQTQDSSGVAAAAHGAVKLAGGAVDLHGNWMQIGDGFGNPANLTLRSGTSDLTLGAKATLGATLLRVEHEYQRFDAADVSRQRTLAGITQALPAKMKIESNVVDDRYTSTAASATNRSTAGEMKVTWTPISALDLYTDARRNFDTQGTSVQPDFVGAGAAYRVLPGVSLEARHREVLLPGDSAGYGITNLGVRSRVGAHSEAWSSYQIAGANGAYNAAIVGLSNQIRFANGWTLNASAERREGVGRASIADPVRALPFLQNEEDYTAVGAGAELLPSGKPYRLSARGEYRDGTLRSVRMFDASGDVSVAKSLALLQRSNFMQTLQGDVASSLSRRLTTMLGLAFRPIGGDALNALAKVEYVTALNPLGSGVLAARGEEARTIAALETVWAPAQSVEIATRYATRRTAAIIAQADGTMTPQRSTADYIGNRFGVDATSWLAVRADTRLLLEHTSGTTRWDAAPQLALSRAGLEAALGYRVGDLRDPDFSVNGGAGWFVTFGAKLTERSAKSAAEFWRNRF
jgi:uncharacterized repeat protein (TIGR01451 family)